MDKEILEVLKAIQEDIKCLEDGQEKIVKRLVGLETKVDNIEKKLDGVVEQTANLLEFRTKVELKLDGIREVEEVTKVNCYDIAKLKAIK